MLKLTVSPGDFIMLGDDIKIMICGGEKANIPITIEAPKSIPVIRNTAKKKRDFDKVDFSKKPYVEKTLSADAKKKITAIVAEDRWKSKQQMAESKES